VAADRVSGRGPVTLPGCVLPAELVEIDVTAALDPSDLDISEERAAPESRTRPTVTDRAREKRSVEIFTVAGLETIVDGDALLRAREPEEPPYWALVWIGARAIASQMLATPPSAQMRVLDLGCGLGLSGIAAASGGAHVTFADYVPQALEFVRASAGHHSLAPERFSTRTLDFTKDDPPERYDVVLAADVVYEPGAYQPLVDFLCKALAPRGTLWLTETLRADARRVLEALCARGLLLETTASWVIEDGRPERTWLHRLVWS
jgi:predicted nicotinamide N-methyase